MMPEPATDLADYALRYAALGWPSFPLRYKAPITAHGVKDASTDPRVLGFRFSDSTATGVGIALGFAVPGMPGYHAEALDIDPRSGGDITLEQLLAAHGPLPDTVVAQSGGGGSHYVLAVPDGQRLKAIGRGIDIKRQGGYLVVEPSLHPSGNRYHWLIESSPFEGAPIAPAPAWLLETATAQVVQLSLAGRGHLAPERVEDLRSALRYLDPDDYHQWVQVGQALHSTEAGEPAFQLWLDWSERSAKFRPGECQRKWLSFQPGRGLHVESIFHWAQSAGWVAADNQPISEEVRVELLARAETAAPVSAPLPFVDPIPVPALQAVADWMSGLDERPSTEISTAGAIALGSVLTGRLYRSENANWTSLLLAVSASSGKGKNYIKTGIHRILVQAGMTSLIAGDFYTHKSAIYWALNQSPCHICISDEFGENFQEARKNNNSNKLTVFKGLKQVFSDADDMYKPESYAMGGSKKHTIEMRPVLNPSLTMLGLTTPRQFYSEIRASHIESGLINRFVVINVTDAGQPPVARSHQAPESIIEFARAVRHSTEPFLHPAHDLAPSPIVVPFSSGARELFTHFASEQEALCAELEPSGMDAMPRRWREIAMRIATMLAACDNPGAPSVSPQMAAWAINYVRHHGTRTISEIRANLGENEYQGAMNAVLAFIQGADGPVTDGTLLRRFRGIKAREMDAIKAHLEGAHLIVGKKTATGGRPITEWLAVPDPE